MQALTFSAVENITCNTVKDPVLLEPGDAIVKISLASICGSDLHVYHGREMGQDHGTIMGHEFVGTVVETGTAVKKFSLGSRVLSPFTSSCGECYYCRIGLTCRCIHGHLFGWMENRKGLEGAQAEFIRVPMADGTLLPLSNDLDETKGLLLGDVFATGYFCAENAIVNMNGIYVVVGCGPVGLMAIVAAKHLGAENVYAIDYIPERLKIASEFGAKPINPNDRDTKDQIADLTEGRGADAVMEAVGGSKALRLAIDLVRHGGIISSVGVHTDQQFPFSPVEAYNKNLTYKSGRCPAKYYAEKLLRSGAVQSLPIEKIISHRFSLKDGAEAYKVFDKKKDNCIKTVLVP